MKTFWNVMSCIAASLLSIVLVVVLLAFPVYRSVISFAKPSTLTSVVQNTDYSLLLPPAEELQKMVGVEWVDAEMINEIIQSDAAGAIIELYANDMVNAILQNGEESQFTAEALKTIADKEMDSLVEIIAPHLPEDAPFTKEELADELRKVVEENAEQIVEALAVIESQSAPQARTVEPEPPAEQEDPFALLRQFLDPTITVASVGAIVLIAALIYLCRFRRFGGMLWLGIDTLVAALPVTVLAIVFGGSALNSLLDELFPSYSALIYSVTDALSAKLTVFAVVYLLIGIALIVGYVLLRRKFVKTKSEPVSDDIPLQETVAD